MSLLEEDTVNTGRVGGGFRVDVNLGLVCEENTAERGPDIWLSQLVGELHAINEIGQSFDRDACIKTNIGFRCVRDVR